MLGMPATYQGRIVSKSNFRAFIYSANGDQKLVESWDDYERHMATGIWFSTKEESQKMDDNQKEDMKQFEIDKDRPRADVMQDRENAKSKLKVGGKSQKDNSQKSDSKGDSAGREGELDDGVRGDEVRHDDAKGQGRDVNSNSGPSKEQR